MEILQKWFYLRDVEIAHHRFIRTFEVIKGISNLVSISFIESVFEYVQAQLPARLVLEFSGSKIIDR